MEAEGEAEGVPLTITPPLDEHRLDVEESEIGRKGIKPKARAWMRRGAPRFLVWNSVTFSGAWSRFSEFPGIPLYPVAFPFDQVLEFSSEHPPVQDFFHNVLLFPIYEFQQRLRVPTIGSSGAGDNFTTLKTG